MCCHLAFSTTETDALLIYTVKVHIKLDMLKQNFYAAVNFYFQASIILNNTNYKQGMIVYMKKWNMPSVIATLGKHILTTQPKNKSVESRAWVYKIINFNSRHHGQRKWDAERLLRCNCLWETHMKIHCIWNHSYLKADIC